MNRHDPRIGAMSPDDFSASLERLGLTQSAAARWMSANRRSVVRWASGDTPIPPTVKLMLQLAESIQAMGGAVPGAAQALRRPGRKPASTVPAE